MYHFFPFESVVRDFICETCELGKHYRSVFSSRVDTRARFSFSLVHYDIWSPNRRIPSMLGNRYFVTFVDDYTRMIWLFLMYS